MPLPPAPPPNKPYHTLHLKKHSNLVKKCSEEWYWVDNFGKFFHKCGRGHEIAVYDEEVGLCPKCRAVLPEEMQMIQKLQKLDTSRVEIPAGTFSSLGDMLLKRYVIDFVADLQTHSQPPYGK
jgi:hypothetical protein